ncbi:hypothetical protein M5K25_018088 [Dendrobium thyrsiflorum]|uniref:C3H1-type domain-containing protein n=1 Tax=Dendrobium thyrsiflorum TaxID=117978 RepID=A0ABD0UH66_DENTH
MAEKVMIRVSKWDVATEAHVETEIKDDYALPAKVDSCSEFVELNHEDHDSDQILRCHDVEPCIPMNVVGTQYGETEIKQDNALTATVDDSCIDLPELNQESHDCGQILRLSEAEACLPMNMDGCETDRLDYQSGQVENNNVTHLDDFCENAPKSKQLDLDGDCKDGFKKRDLELVSHDQTMEYSEHQDKPLKATNAMSPVPEERRQGNHNIYPTDGWGRSGRKRSRSFSQDSRSTSPSNASKHGCESWVEKCSTRPAATACRDFAAGRCRRGSECIYLHEGGGSSQIERHHDSASPDERESRFERGRHQGYVSRESLTDSTQKINYSREKSFRRHEDHIDDERGNNEQRKYYRSSETCFDFTRDRCHRGASCRYIHHETSFDGERNVRDELSGRVHNRRDGRTSFGRSLEPQRVSSIPCKFFLEGRCRHGENCRFFHQVGPLSNAEDRLHHDSSHQRVSPCDRTSANASELLGQVAHFGPSNSLLMGSDNALRVGNSKPIVDKNFSNKSVCDRHPTVIQDAHSETQPSGKQISRNIRQKFPANVNTEGARERKEADFANNILPITSAGQNFQQSGQSQIALQVMNAQKFASNSPSQQFVPQLPLNGQMLQVINQSGQNPVTSLHEPSGAHHFIATMQNRSTHPPESNPQKFDYGRQVQASLLVQSHVGNQQNHIVNERIQQNLPLPHNGQSDPRFTVSGQKQNLPSQVGHSRQDIIVTADTRHILPQNVQRQQHSFASLVSNGQIHLMASKPPLNPEKISSDEKDRQLTSENNLNAMQQSKQIASGKPLQEADLSEIKSSVFNSDNLITHKFVTTEQAAKITDLSASLAQFFGTAALNSQTRTGILPPADLSPGSLATVVAPLLTEIEGSITNLNHSAPSALTVSEKSHKQIRTIEQIREGGDASSKEAENFEKLHNKEELSARLKNGDPEVSRDGDAKRSKENKGFRMFKCALVELVKEMLKPTWKEGQLSKEAHNTIVKKVVDKVTGSVQGHNAPQTQEKIDLYLLSSKAKLSKLVQAYVEKYVGR